MTERLELLRGSDLGPHLDALAALRIRVFRDWPYLYEGTADYERHYLETYLRSPNSLIVLVWDGEACVGASTVLPLAEASADAQKPFVEGGHDVGRIDYFGESILLKPYRGRGHGVSFFEAREAHAQLMELPVCAFCAVERPEQHPLKPADYVPNDAFWARRGYRKAPEIRTHYSWPDIGETETSAKPTTFWLRELRRAGKA